MSKKSKLKVKSFRVYYTHDSKRISIEKLKGAYFDRPSDLYRIYAAFNGNYSSCRGLSQLRTIRYEKGPIIIRNGKIERGNSEYDLKWAAIASAGDVYFMSILETLHNEGINLENLDVHDLKFRYSDAHTATRYKLLDIIKFANPSITSDDDAEMFISKATPHQFTLDVHFGILGPASVYLVDDLGNALSKPDKNIHLLHEGDCSLIISFDFDWEDYVAAMIEGTGHSNGYMMIARSNLVDHGKVSPSFKVVSKTKGVDTTTVIKKLPNESMIMITR